MLLLAAIWMVAIANVGAVQVTSIFSFNGANGSAPVASLLCLGNGLLYGTTYGGGASSNGTVFVFDPVSKTIVSEFSFSGTNGHAPMGALIQGQEGFLYGTTYDGNPGLGYIANVFKISTNLVFTNLHSLGGINGPASGVIQWTNGALYGVSYQGGSFGSGQLFSLTPDGSSFSQFSFGGIGATGNGANPYGSLTLAGDGSIYGTASLSGTNGDGTIFKLSSSGSLSTVFSFNFTNGGEPSAALLVGSDSYFYGTTYGGGSSNYGTVFKFNRTNNALTTLYSFTNGNDGGYPRATLVEVTNGVFYGTTSTTNGGIFQITSNGVFSIVAALSGTNGNTSWAGLVRGTDGNFYGTTTLGGTYDQGTIFRISTDATLNTSPPVFQQTAISNGMFIVSATAVSGQSYQVQYRTNLFSGSWGGLGSPATASNGLVTFSDPMTATQKYYRVQLVQ